jgi:hypothetical protein
MKRGGILIAVVALFCLLASGVVFAQNAAPEAQAGATVSAVPAEKAPMPTKLIKLHEVKAGEDLHLIAGYYYGDARQWKKIWALNKKELRNPNRIEIGQMIKVEVGPNWQPKFSMEQYIAQRGVAATVRKPGEPAKKTTYIHEKEDVHSTATPRLLEESPGDSQPQQGNTQDSGAPR